MYTVNQVMELSGINTPGLAIRWIKDALIRMGVGGIASEQVQLYDIETDKNVYRFPFDIGSDFKISVLYDNGGTDDSDRYMPIRRIVGEFTFHVETDATPDKDYEETGITDNTDIIDSLDTKRWGWVNKPSGIGLYEWDSSNGYYTAPSLDINDGLKISYLGIVCFIDAADAVVASPTEASYINVGDAYVPAIVTFLQAKVESDLNARRVMYRQFLTEVAQVKRTLSGSVLKVMPIGMYSIKRYR